MPDTFGGWFGELFGELLYEMITGEDHPSSETKTIEIEIIQKQNKVVGKATKATWDAYMRSYDMQQEAQLAEAQMTLTVAPRIIKAGLKGGVEAVIFGTTYNEIEKHAQKGDPKTTVSVVAISFVAGFVAGASMEIWNIIEECRIY